MRPTTARRAAFLPLLACSLAATGALATPSTGQAQRGLMGAVKRRAAQEVLGGALGARSAAPAFDERVLEITAARLDQLLVGLRAEAEQAVAGERAYAADADRARAARVRLPRSALAVRTAGVRATSAYRRGHGPASAR
jgi:hypothetical protein